MKYSNSTMPITHIVGSHIKFKKTGKQIKEAVATKIAEQNERLNAEREKATALATKLGVEVDSAVAETEKEDQDLHEESLGGGGPMPMSASVPVGAARQTMKQMQDLQDDIQKMKAAARKILEIKRNINTYELLTQHIEEEREFDLFYGDLVSFGF